MQVSQIDRRSVVGTSSEPITAKADACRRETTPFSETLANCQQERYMFGTRLTDTTLERAANLLIEYTKSNTKISVSFLNAHCVNVLYRDDYYRSAVNKCDLVFADGSGMRIAAKVAGEPLQDNVNGTDLFPVLCDQVAIAGESIYLLGGTVGVAAAAAETMKSRNSNLTISGTSPAYFESRQDEDDVIQEINASGASIVLVGMGVPLQELWIERNRNRLNARVVIGVGGLFDYYSGRLARAPKLIRIAGFEWAWRLALEPKRLARRYLVGNIEFLWRVMRQNIETRTYEKKFE